MLRRVLIVLYSGTVSYGSIFASSYKETARTLEYQDKVNDFELEVLSTTMHRDNAYIAHQQIDIECSYLENLVRRGHEHSAQLKSCKNAVTSANVHLDQANVNLESAKRNAEIWKLRLAMEKGDEIDLKQLEKLYKLKWDQALVLVRAQIESVSQKLKLAVEHERWSKSQFNRGNISINEYDRAVLELATIKNEAKLIETREKAIREILATFPESEK